MRSIPAKLNLIGFMVERGHSRAVVKRTKTHKAHRQLLVTVGV
jgi:hypothetical protein